MAGGSLGDTIGASEELIKKACSLSRKAKNPYLSDKIRGSSETVFAFSGSWSVSDWFAGNNAFGESKVDLKVFPSLRSIGTDEDAKANEAFIGRFASILGTSSLQAEVEKAVKEKKRVVFAGHSSGGPVASLATIYFLEKWPRTESSQKPFRCITFGSPLTGDRIFPHALRREKWADCFIHFVMKYDIVPRIMLSPRASIEQQLGTILPFLNPKSKITDHELNERSKEVSDFFMTVMRNASAVASHAACSLKGSTNLLLETLTNFIQLSPYRPFGTYIFCSGNGRLAVVKNSDAVLQLLFYCCQLNSEAEAPEIAIRSLREHLGYESELKECLEMQDVVCLDPPEELPLTSDGSALPEAATTINRTLIDLGLSTTARLCLRAAGELEKQKQRNQDKVDSNKRTIEDKLNNITDYQTGCRVRKIGYYDAFKLSKDINDFNANVTRLELAGMWDEVIEMLKRYELPDEFEGRKEWIELGTKFRRLVEPLDIANYYRHAKNDDTGPYMKLGRPKRYKFTQRWLEHALRKPPNAFSESCFWAVLEEKIASNRKSPQDEEEIATEALKWVEAEEKAGEDIFLDGSTFVIKWWKTLPPGVVQKSRLASPYDQFKKKNAG